MELSTPLNDDDVRRRTTEIGEWDQRFIEVDQELLFELILVANYLDIKPLLLSASPTFRISRIQLSRSTSN